MRVAGLSPRPSRKPQAVPTGRPVPGRPAGAGSRYTAVLAHHRRALTASTALALVAALVLLGLAAGAAPL